MVRFVPAMLLAAGFAGSALLSAPTAQASVPLPVIAQVGVPTLAPVLKKITPAVISIAIKGHTVEAGKKRDVRAAGSGVVFDANQGLIITNNHVIAHADEITVTLSDGRNVPATRVGGDPDTDIAVVRIAPDHLTALTFGDLDQLEVGDFVLAIGNPFSSGRPLPPASSAAWPQQSRHRAVRGFHPDRRRDLSRQFGRRAGQPQRRARRHQYRVRRLEQHNLGVGFAIPINMARNVADQIMEYGEISRGSLGITIDDPTPSVFRELKMPVSTAAAPVGAVVISVDAGSAGARAGLKSGDIVTEVGKTAIRDSGALRNRMALLRIGEVAELSVLRDGKPLTVHATMAAATPEPPRGKAK